MSTLAPARTDFPGVVETAAGVVDVCAYGSPWEDMTLPAVPAQVADPSITSFGSRGSSTPSSTDLPPSIRFVGGEVIDCNQ